jgi:hypothetical protein
MKLNIFVILTILLMATQAAGGVCVQGDCINGQGTAVLPDGRKYVGEFRDGIRSGRGLMTFPDGTKYLGDWQNDNPHGQGTLSAVGKFEYTGEFVDSVRQGHGTLETVDGRIYVGQWQNDVPHGQGRITYPNKEEFVGQFENGRRNGLGEVTYPDGTRYKGQWKDDLPNGEGVRIFPDGMQYSGEFRNGLMHGSGMVVMPDGSQFKIQWQGDVLVEKEEKQPEAAYSTAGEKGDWYMRTTSKETRGLPGLEPEQSPDALTVSGRAAAAAEEETTGREVVLPVQAVEQPPAPKSAEVPVAVEAQVQPEALQEIQTEAVKKEEAEVSMNPKAEQASVPAAPRAQIYKSTGSEEYASVGRVAGGANIRSEALRTSEVLRAVPPGYPLIVLERQGDWVLVEDYRERRGWIFASLLSGPGTAIIKVWKGNLRSGPGLTDAVITQLEHGTVLSVVETRGDWLQVNDPEGLSGWLHRDVVWP